MNSVGRPKGVTMELTTERIRARTEQQGDCIVWIGAKANGYPMARHNGNMMVVSRRVVEIRDGVELTKDQRIRHTCDNRLCVNPDHLVIYERGQKGYAAGGAKKIKTKAEVEAIMAEWNKTPDYKNKIMKFCYKYDISQSTLLTMRRGKYEGSD